MASLRTNRLLDKLYQFQNDPEHGVLRWNGGMSYLCYVFGVEYGGLRIPKFTAWEKAKLKELLQLFRPTRNELLATDPHAFVNVWNFTHDDPDEPITCIMPWWGEYGRVAYNPMREMAFWLIIAMLENE